jgi:hypothetical protein
MKRLLIITALITVLIQSAIIYNFQQRITDIEYELFIRSREIARQNAQFSLFANGRTPYEAWKLSHDDWFGPDDPPHMGLKSKEQFKKEIQRRKDF